MLPETREQQIAESTERLLRDLDEEVNELAPVPGALPNQTVSDHVALAAKSGAKWGCLFCTFLSLTVQRDHCAETLKPNGIMPWHVYPRASAMFLVILSMPALIWLFGLWTAVLILALVIGIDILVGKLIDYLNPKP
jgi:hypothetical protein